jgi:hypothetical protein
MTASRHRFMLANAKFVHPNYADPQLEQVSDAPEARIRGSSSRMSPRGGCVRPHFGHWPTPTELSQEGRVGIWRGCGRPGMSVSASFVWRCLCGSAIAPFPHPSHRTQRADFPHCALGQDFTPSSTARRVQAGSDARAQRSRRGARVDSCRPCSGLRQLFLDRGGASIARADQSETTGVGDGRGKLAARGPPSTVQRFRGPPIIKTS